MNIDFSPPGIHGSVFKNAWSYEDLSQKLIEAAIRLQASRDMLIAFSRDFLSGEGDVTKHLGYLGYHVSHQQRALDEYDYAVENLATDLRDGVRLVWVNTEYQAADCLSKQQWAAWFWLMITHI